MAIEWDMGPRMGPRMGIEIGIKNGKNDWNIDIGVNG